MQDRLQEVEEEVARLETEIAQAETALQVFVSVEESQRQTESLDRAKNELSQRMAEWEELASVLGS
jgi:septal ring factor EnvC (AmiA/AmiB activator)